METKSKNDFARLNQHKFEVLSTFIVCLMMTCIGVSFSQLGLRMIPDWKAGILPLICFLVALERAITIKHAKKLVIFSKEWWIFQGTQWVVILLFLKIALWIASPPESWIVEFQLMRINFLDHFIDIHYTYHLFFIILIWLVAGYFTGLLNEMSLDESLIRFENAIMAPVEERPARERLLGAFFTIGFILVTITAVLRLNLRSLLQGGGAGEVLMQPLPYLAAGAWNVLFYFILGLSLMSLSQFARLNARWSFQKIEVNPKLASRWAGYSIGFILLIAFVTSLLPTNYSLGLLSSFEKAIMIVYSFAVFIVGFLFSLLIFLIGLLGNFFGLETIESSNQAPMEFIPPEIPVEAITNGTNPWWDLIRSLIFWMVTLSLIGFSLTTFIKHHADYFQNFKNVRLFSWLVKAWHSFRLLFKAFNQQISTAIDSGINRLRSRQSSIKVDEVRKLFQYRRLDNRQRVLLTFFTMIRRSGQKGIKRAGSQTPYEFATKLEATLPETEEEIDGITDAFVIARYSKTDMDEERVSLTRHYWSKIRNALKSIRN